MNKKDYYDILGINKNSNESEIKKAYRQLAKTKHPDVGGDENEFKEISEAYEVLSNPDKKKNYDMYGHNGRPAANGFGGMNMDDLFREFGFANNFAQNRSRPRFGQDLRINIPLTLEEILNGTNKTIKYNRNAACTSCNSAGGHDINTCPTCHGQGSVVQHVRTPMGIMQTVEQCPSCYGLGTTYAVQCNICQGEGVQRGEQEISIDIPAGILDGNMLHYNGMGNAIKNGSAGKLIINITEVAHKTYVRNGNDIKYNLKLGYPQLVLGDKVEIPTIDGTSIKIHIPEYSKTGDNLRINGKGMKQVNSSTRGDMYVILDVDFPKKINDEERELLNNLKKVNETVVKS
jgi:molecular chaperone DnaJ